MSKSSIHASSEAGGDEKLPPQPRRSKRRNIEYVEAEESEEEGVVENAATKAYAGNSRLRKAAEAWFWCCQMLFLFFSIQDWQIQVDVECRAGVWGYWRSSPIPGEKAGEVERISLACEAFARRQHSGGLRRLIKFAIGHSDPLREYRHALIIMYVRK